MVSKDFILSEAKDLRCFSRIASSSRESHRRCFAPLSMNFTGGGARMVNVSLLLLIPLLPALGALINGIRAFAKPLTPKNRAITNRRRARIDRHSPRCSRRGPSSPTSAAAPSRRSSTPTTPGSRRESGRSAEGTRRLRRRLRVPHRSALLHDAADRHVDRLPDPRLRHRLHGARRRATRASSPTSTSSCS